MEEKILTALIETLGKMVESNNTKFDLLINAIASGSLQGSKLEPCSFTFFSWLDEWYNIYKSKNSKKSTQTAAEVCIRLHIKPNFLDLPLNQIRGMDLQRLLLKIKNSRTRVNVYDVLNNCFEMAKGFRYIAENPMDGVQKPKHKRKSYAALDGRAQNAVLSTIQNKKYLAFFWYCVCTGMRLTEAIQSVPFIDIKRCVVYVQGDDTSTKKHKRTVEILPELMTTERLRLLKEVKASAAQSYFKRLFKRLKLKLCVHSFRHTFASCCHHVRISDKWTQSRLGHSSIEMTMDTYVELIDDINSPILDYFRRLKNRYNL